MNQILRFESPQKGQKQDINLAVKKDKPQPVKYRKFLDMLQGDGRQFRYFINLRSLTQGDEEIETR